MSEAVEWLLTDNGLDVNRESESFKRLCREMLKMEVKILDIAKHRDLGDYEYEETVFQQAPVFSPDLDNRSTETIPISVPTIIYGLLADGEKASN